MSLKRKLLNGIANTIYRIAGALAPGVYAKDGLISVHNHDFMRDPAFLRAYERGVQAIGGKDEYNWHWRIHIGLWAADMASRIAGDFVECGVNKGFLSSAIMRRLDWNSTGRKFYLLDTFSGLDPRQVTEAEIRAGALEKNAESLRSNFYVSGVDGVRANFAEWNNVVIVAGAIPDTLGEVKSEHIAYLHIDMNCAPPEVAALTHFWDRLSDGAVVLLDDYAYLGFGEQKRAMDDFARAHGVSICSLPTGQGLLLRPPR
ncbi:MAG: TylF/MycF/NovP-related O-methyltransferase [Burkholderiales bacterium]|nr:TylF/MycF/NovP-related O-methyltransferase [Burkholderiales bacterium]